MAAVAGVLGTLAVALVDLRSAVVTGVLGTLAVALVQLRLAGVVAAVLAAFALVVGGLHLRLFVTVDTLCCVCSDS